MNVLLTQHVMQHGSLYYWQGQQCVGTVCPHRLEPLILRFVCEFRFKSYTMLFQNNLTPENGIFLDYKWILRACFVMLCYSKSFLHRVNQTAHMKDCVNKGSLWFMYIRAPKCRYNQRYRKWWFYFIYLLVELEQLERLRSEDTPRRPV